MLILWLEEVGYQNVFFLGLSFLGRGLFEWRTSKYEFIDNDDDCQKRLMGGFLRCSINLMRPIPTNIFNQGRFGHWILAKITSLSITTYSWESLNAPVTIQATQKVHKAYYQVGQSNAPGIPLHRNEGT